MGQINSHLPSLCSSKISCGAFSPTISLTQAEEYLLRVAFVGSFHSPWTLSVIFPGSYAEFSLPSPHHHHDPIEQGMWWLTPQGLLSCIHRKLSSTPCPDKPIATEQQPSLSGFTSKASGQPFLSPLEVPCFLSASIFTVMSQASNFGVFQGQGTLFKLFEWLPTPLISFTWFRIWELTFFSHRKRCRDSN